MSGDRKFSIWFDELMTDPEFRESYDKARHELDTKWEIECRYGNCVIFVSPDSSVGPEQDDGWGPIDCPCKANEDGYWAWD